MRERFVGSACALTVVIVALAPAAVPVAGQALGASAKTTGAKTWTPPRTPDGQPDLQGTWTNSNIALFERPRALAGKEFFTPEEVAEVEAQTGKGRIDPAWAAKVRFTPDDALDSGDKVVPTRRTSLVVDPPDGRVPLKPEAEDQRDHYRSNSTRSWEYMTTWDRCITRGVPGSIGNTLYGNYYQILQVPGYVMIRYEMIHDVRIIPVDGRPHLGPNIRQWLGDSRGHWEGNTLVVETTNFNGKSMVMTHEGAGRVKGVLQSTDSKVIERFTRTGQDRISYQATVEDPKAFTRPWTFDIPLTKSDQDILEYACHEGNYEMAIILGGDEAGRKIQADIVKRSRESGSGYNQSQRGADGVTSQAPSAPARTFESLATVPTARIENLVEAPDGSIYISAVRDRTVFRVSPDGRATVFANLSSTAAQITGIALTEDGGLVVAASFPAAGQATPPRGAAPGTLTVDSYIVVLDKSGNVTETVPGGHKGWNFNGLAQLRIGVYLITDLSDVIWQFDLASKGIEPWLNDDLLKGTGPPFGGANGIKVHDTSVYAAVGGSNAVYRILVGADGKPSGSPRLVGEGFRPDDFAVAKDGSVYGFGNGKEDREVMYRISPTGEVTKFLDGAPHGASVIASKDGKWLYWASQADPEPEKLYRVAIQ